MNPHFFLIWFVIGSYIMALHQIDLAWLMSNSFSTLMCSLQAVWHKFAFKGLVHLNLVPKPPSMGAWHSSSLHTGPLSNNAHNLGSYYIFSSTCSNIFYFCLFLIHKGYIIVLSKFLLILSLWLIFSSFNWMLKNFSNL